MFETITVQQIEFLTEVQHCHMITGQTLHTPNLQFIEHENISLPIVNLPNKNDF